VEVGGSHEVATSCQHDISAWLESELDRWNIELYQLGGVSRDDNVVSKVGVIQKSLRWDDSLGG
jgi:hypothetical protein